MAVIALLQAIMFGVQLWQIQESLKHTRTSLTHTRAAVEASVNVERPHVICDGVVLQSVAPPVGESDEHYYVTFVFTNYGRTPAFPLEIRFGKAVAKEIELPTPPQYGPTMQNIQGLLKPGETTRVQVPTFLAITPAQRAVLGKDGTFVWFWGQVRYTDVFDGIAETGFIAMQYPPEHLPDGTQIMGETIVFRGPAAYAYRRYRQTADQKG